MRDSSSLAERQARPADTIAWSHTPVDGAVERRRARPGMRTRDRAAPLAPGGRRIQGILQAALDIRLRGGIDQSGAAWVQVFGERRLPGDDDRQARRERFERRDPEPLLDRGESEDAGDMEERGHVVVGHHPELDDRRAEGGRQRPPGALERLPVATVIEDRGAPRDPESRARMPRMKTSEGVEQAERILPLLDSPDAEDDGPGSRTQPVAPPRDPQGVDAREAFERDSVAD